MKNCPSCQSAAGDDASFCPACGTPLAQTPAPLSEEPAPPEQSVHAEQPAWTEPQPQDPAQPVWTESQPVQPAPPEQPVFSAQPQEPAQPYYPAQPVYPARSVYASPPPVYTPPSPYTSPIYASPVYASPAGPTGPAVDTVKSFGGSILFLLAALAMSLSIIFSAVTSITVSNDVFTRENLTEFFRSADIKIDRDAEQAIDAMSGAAGGTSVVSTIFGLIPSILIALGMWLFFASCKSPRPGVSTGGLTLLKVMSIISLVFVCLAALLVILVFGLLFAGIGIAGNASNADTRIAGVVFGVILGVCAAVFAFFIIYYSKIIQTLSGVIATLRTGRPDRKTSMYVIVVNFITSISSLFSAVALPLMMKGIFSREVFRENDMPNFNLLFGDSVQIPSILASLCSAAVLILVSVCMMQYRGRMRELPQ